MLFLQCMLRRTKRNRLWHVSVVPPEHAPQSHKGPGALSEDKAFPIENGSLAPVGPHPLPLQAHGIHQMPEPCNMV